MILAQAGHFKIDTTVAEILPELRSQLPNIDVDHITIRHLLNHTSGVPTYTALNQGLYDKALKDPTRVWSQEDVLAVIAEASKKKNFQHLGHSFITAIPIIIFWG